MGGSPNFNKAKNKARVKQTASSFKIKTKDIKYPTCVGLGLYDTCPNTENNVLCTKCPHYIHKKNKNYALELLKLKNSRV